MDVAEQLAVRGAVAAAWRGTFYHPAVDRDDAAQEAAIAVLRARDRRDDARSDPEIAHWLHRTALGGIRDALRRERVRDGGARSAPGFAGRYTRLVSLTPVDDDGASLSVEPAHLDTPEALLEAKQALASLDQLRPDARQVAALLRRGELAQDAAEHIGLTPSRVSQIKREVATFLLRRHGRSSPDAEAPEPATSPEDDATVALFESFMASPQPAFRSEDDATVHLFKRHLGDLP